MRRVPPLTGLPPSLEDPPPPPPPPQALAARATTSASAARRRLGPVTARRCTAIPPFQASSAPPARASAIYQEPVAYPRCAPSPYQVTAGEGGAAPIHDRLLACARAVSRQVLRRP